MADDLKNRGEPDRSRINTSEDHEIRYWTQKFGVSADELRAAVQAVGTSADAVAKHLAGGKSRGA
jgi:hypothetical protein